MFNTVGDKPDGNKKKDDGWGEGKNDEGYHQFSPQFWSQNLPFSLEDQFHQISDHQEDQKEDEDDIDIDQAEKNDVIGNGNLSCHLRGFQLNGCKDDDQDTDDPNDHQLIAAPSLVWGEFFLHCLENKVTFQLNKTTWRGLSKVSISRVLYPFPR